MLTKEYPDHHDATIILQLYDLRREALMRESRAAVYSRFRPQNVEEAVAVLKQDHPLNSALRQVVGYWEMVYGMARHGIIHELLHERELLGRGHRPDLGPRVERVAHAQPRRAVHHARDEALGELFHDVDALDARTGLPGVGEASPLTAGNGVFRLASWSACGRRERNTFGCASSYDFSASSSALERSSS